MKVTDQIEHEGDAKTLASLRGDGRWGVTGDRSHAIYPYRACGQLFSTYQGVNYRCSASVIGDNLLLTAAHCVSPGGSSGVHSDIRYAPNAPKHIGTVRVVRAFIMSGWENEGRYSEDLAVLVTEDSVSQDGYHSVAVEVPWAFRPNLPAKHYGWWSLSYPAEPPFSGTDQVNDGGPADKTPFLFGSGWFWGADHEALSRNDMTPGSSGGPWMLNPSDALPRQVVIQGRRNGSGRVQVVNGVNSFKYDSLPGTMMTPYFGKRVRAFLLDVLAAL